MATRIAIQDFALANSFYIGASVEIYVADSNGEATETLATLYEAPTGTNTLTNPQELDSEGKFKQPVYVEEDVVLVIDGSNAESTETFLFINLASLTERSEDAADLAEDWATKTGDTVDDTEYSAKAYASSEGLIASGSAKEWSADAEGYAADSLASSSLAEEWAENPEDDPVTTGPNKYSALHWAAKSEESAASIDTARQTPKQATDSGTDAYQFDAGGNVSDGQIVIVTIPASNSTVSPTGENIGGDPSGAAAIVTESGDAYIGMLEPRAHGLQWDNSNTQWVVLDPAPLEAALSLVSLSVGTKNNPAAAGDGTTDDRAAIVALAEELRDNGGGTLDGNGKTYRVDSEIDLSSLENVLVQNATFDYSNVSTSGKLFGGGGELTATTTSLTADADHGDVSITVSDTSSFTKDDWIMIERAQAFGTGSTGVVSELTRVRQIVDATTIRLHGSLDYNYPSTDSSKITKITPVENIYFERCEFIGNGDESQEAFRPSWLRNVNIKNCIARGWASRAFGFDSSWNIVVEGCEVEDAGVDLGLNYGVAFTSGCHWSTVRDCTFMNVRHGVSTGGSSYVNRHINVINCHVLGARDAAFDSHRICDHFLVDGCSANTLTSGSVDGIISQAAHSTIVNNRIYGTNGTRKGIFVQPLIAYTGLRPSATISNNRIVSKGENAIDFTNQSETPAGAVIITGNEIVPNTGSFTYGVNVFANTDNISFVIVSSNVITGITVRGIHIVNSTGQVIVRGSITANQVNMLSTDGGVEAIRINSDAAGDIEDFAISANQTVSGNWGIRGVNDDRINVVGNVVTGSTNGISMDGASSNVAQNIT